MDGSESLATLEVPAQAPLPQHDPTHVITVRLPASIHAALKKEAHGHELSMNQLCIAKLLQLIEAEQIESMKAVRRQLPADGRTSRADALVSTEAH